MSMDIRKSMIPSKKVKGFPFGFFMSFRLKLFIAEISSKLIGSCGNEAGVIVVTIRKIDKAVISINPAAGTYLSFKK
jgi:hypothetical protein